MKSQRNDYYPSRQGKKEKIIERKEKVVPNKSLARHKIGSKLVDDFERKGYCITQKVFSKKEIKLLENGFQLLAGDQSLNKRQEFIKEPNSDEIRSIFNVHRFSDVFYQLSKDDRIVGVAEALIGEEVYIHQARINAKPGFSGAPFQWHSDFETWHVEDGMPKMNALSALITLNDNKEYNGPLMIMPGSHHYFISCAGITPENNHKQSLKKQEVGVPSNQMINRFYDIYGIDLCTCPAGSVLFFDCNVLHGSAGNISPLGRSNIFFVFNAISNQLEAPFGKTKERPHYIANRNPKKGVYELS